MYKQVAPIEIYGKNEKISLSVSVCLPVLVGYRQAPIYSLLLVSGYSRKPGQQVNNDQTCITNNATKPKFKYSFPKHNIIFEFR